MSRGNAVTILRPPLAFPVGWLRFIARGLSGLWALSALACMALMVACGSGGEAASTHDGLEPVPGEESARAVRVHPHAGAASTWCVLRTWPDERIRVFSQCDRSTPKPLPFPRGDEGELLVFAVAESGPYLYLLVYDARRNVPSGRIPGVVDDGIDVYRADRRTPLSNPELVATRLPLGGFDHLIEASADAGGLTACGVRTCLRIEAGLAAAAWSDPALNAYEFVEVTHRGGFVDTIVRSVDNGFTGSAVDASFHYAWARLGPAGLQQLQPIPPDCVPFRLREGPDPVAAPQWSCARTPAELARLFEYDLARMPAGGLMDFGASNLEGRIAWSQAYYLNGLLELTGPHLAGLGAHIDREALAARVTQEVDLLARMQSEAKGYGSRRYSMRRSENTFALHLGRISRTLALAVERGIAVAPAALERLSGRMWALADTVEQPSTSNWRGTVNETLAYRRGADFWCDGANVPHNYVTAYVHGLLALRGADVAARQRAAAFIAPLFEFEPVASANTWNYWWGRGFDGWSVADAVSINTPDYVGYRDPAHISYRSLDALAVLRLSEADPAAVPATVVDNIRRLVTSGGLLPWVNGELSRSGRPVTLSREAAYRHARSAGTWEIEAQVWGLERLAAGP